MMTEVQWVNFLSNKGWMDSMRLFVDGMRSYDGRTWNIGLNWFQAVFSVRISWDDSDLVFDNWRVLHGRSAFTGERRMCGAYISRDAFRSRYLTTNVDRERLLLEIWSMYRHGMEQLNLAGFAKLEHSIDLKNGIYFRLWPETLNWKSTTTRRITSRNLPIQDVGRKSWECKEIRNANGTLRQSVYWWEGIITVIIQSVIQVIAILIWCRTCADCGFIIGEGLVKANAALGVFICL